MLCVYSVRQGSVDYGLLFNCNQEYLVIDNKHVLCYLVQRQRKDIKGGYSVEYRFNENKAKLSQAIAVLWN